jgi:ABC-type nitrate/sulfonate/bicarbonate transport system substrate-binding protein
MKRSILAFAAALLLASPALSAEKVVVAKPTPTGYTFSIITLGVETGIFKKHGLDVEVITMGGGAKLAQAMISGSVDIGFSSGADFSYLTRGAPQRAVAAMAGPLLNIGIIVRPDNSVPTVADLKGRRIGITTAGSLTDWAARELSRRQGWGPEGMQLVATGGPDASIAALTTKNIDGYSGAIEGGYQLESQGRAKVLVNFGDTIKTFLTHVIYASPDMMTKREAALREFLKGWFETVAFMREHRDETVRITRTVTHLSPEIAARVYDVQKPMFLTDGHFDRAAVEVVKQSIVQLGQADSVPPDDRLFTEKFLP